MFEWVHLFRPTSTWCFGRCWIPASHVDRWKNADSNLKSLTCFFWEHLTIDRDEMKVKWCGDGVAVRMKGRVWIEFLDDWWWDLPSCCKRESIQIEVCLPFLPSNYEDFWHHSSRIFEHLWVWVLEKSMAKKRRAENMFLTCWLIVRFHQLNFIHVPVVSDLLSML